MSEHLTKEERAQLRDELFLLLNQVLPEASPGQVLRLVQLLEQIARTT